MRLRLLLPLALLVTLQAPAGASEQSERLVLGDLPGSSTWTMVTDESSAEGWIQEYIPAGQSVPDYKDIWVVQGFPALKGMDPGRFLAGMLKGAEQSCESVRVNGPKASEEEELKVAYAQLYCGRQVGQDFGANLHIKVISGRDALYVIQREFRVPPSTTAGVQSFPADKMKEMIELMRGQEEANRHLSSNVYVCAPAAAQGRCAPPQ